MKSKVSFATVSLISSLCLVAQTTAADKAKQDRPYPVPTYQEQPAYPKEMRKLGVQGEVVIDFVVGTDGTPKRVKAIRSSRPEFEASAVKAVTAWRFKPATKDGLPVETHMQVPILLNP